MQKFLKKHYSKVILVLIFLFLIKSIQSCNRKNNLERIEKQLTGECDTIMMQKDSVIQYFYDENQILKDSIKNLNYEIKVAGIKVDEASKRADAVQSAVEKVKTNTTIKIETQKNDTIK